MSIRVYVWPNNKNPFGGIQKHPGHASLEWNANSKAELYISWWPATSWAYPEETAANQAAGVSAYTPKSLEHDAYRELGESSRLKLAANTVLPRQGQVFIKAFGTSGKDLKFSGFTPVEQFLEYDLWIKRPDLQVFIPEYNQGYSAEWPDAVPKIIGLYPLDIQNWWLDFSRKGVPGAPGFFHMDNQYEFNSRDLNCCSVVGRALDYGGARLFFNRSYTEHRTWFYNTPLSVYDYALDLNTRIKEYRQFVLTLNSTPFLGGTTEPWPYSEADKEMPSVDEWLKISYVKHRFQTARRIEQILEIDKNLVLFWATKASDPSDFGKQLELLFKMLRSVKDHVTKKPTSDRRNAVLKFGKRIVNVIEYLNFLIAS